MCLIRAALTIPLGFALLAMSLVWPVKSVVLELAYGEDFADVSRAVDGGKSLP